MLSVSGLHAGYGRVRVLSGIDLEVPSGDLRVIIGPNGAGKSTLLKVVFGLLRAARGTVRHDDAEITNCAPKALLGRGIAYVPQHPSIFPHLTVEDNLEMGLFQMARGDSDAVARVFARFELLQRRRKVLAQALSGGERRLLEIARALMVQPRLLLLDEPSLGLSPVMMERLLEEIGRINGEGVTVVLVEQRIKAALSVAKSLSVLRLGRIVHSGAAAAARDPERLAQLLYGARRPGEAIHA
jgi:branched-chain amino acid transport system ATP-binding protein